VKRERKHIIKNEKIRKILSGAFSFWAMAFQLLNIMRIIINPDTNKFSHIFYNMKRYNIFLAAFPASFIFILVVKLMEFHIQFNLNEVVAENKTIIRWFIKHFNISHKKDQIILKDETCLLVIQLILCIVGFFIGLRWYLVGSLSMLFYFFLYIKMNSRD